MKIDNKYKMTKKETMQIMLQDVVDQFVVNPKSRGLKNGSCRYNPGNPKISPGCAIGMYLEVHFKDDNIYVKLEGEYDSYGSYNHDYFNDKARITEVKPKKVEVVIYE